MATIAPAYLTVNPSLMLPDVIVPYYQTSSVFECFPEGDMRQMLGDGDLMVYLNRLDVRTKMAAGNSAYNLLPSCSVIISQIACPTYLMRVRAEYDHHDTSAAGRRNISIVQAQHYAMEMGHFQLARTAALYGFNPANGEGLLNTPGATLVTLPADTFGNTTVTTYDNAQMAFFLQSTILATKTRTLQLGQGRKITILGPQRTLGLFEYNIVALGQYQAKGGGVASTAGLVEAIAQNNGDEIVWGYDDTLQGKGVGGTDAVLVVMPEVKKPVATRANTNRFADLQNGMTSNTMMLCDMAAPREIPTPMPGGAIDVLSEMRITPGWAVRPEAVTVVSMPYQ